VNNFYKFLGNFVWTPVAIDKAHTALIYGMVLSTKPKLILELGIGSGFITKTVLYALGYNGVGNLTSVDNWHDWQGKEPKHIKELRELGCNVVAPIEEETFVKSNQDKRYDIIIVDGNHRQGGNWAHLVYNMLNDNGILFAHDVRMPQYPTLRRYEDVAGQHKDFYTVFNVNSRQDEMCNRGLLMIMKGGKE